MHESGLVKIKQAKEDCSWTVLDNIENGIIPKDLQIAFNLKKKCIYQFILTLVKATVRVIYIGLTRLKKKPQDKKELRR